MENLFELLKNNNKTQINKKINENLEVTNNHIFDEYIKAIIEEILKRKKIFIDEKKTSLTDFQKVLVEFTNKFYNGFIKKEKTIVIGLKDSLRHNPEEQDIFEYRNRKLIEMYDENRVKSKFKKINDFFLLEYKKYKE